MSLLYNFFELTACVLTFLLYWFPANYFLQKSERFRSLYVVLFGILITEISWYPLPLLNNDQSSLLLLALFLLMYLVLYRARFLTCCGLLLLLSILDLVITSIVINLFLLFPDGSVDLLITPGSDFRVYYLITVYLLEYLAVGLICSLIRWKSFSLNRKEVLLSGIFFLCDFSVTFLLYIIRIYHTSDRNGLTLTLLLINILIIVLSLAGLYLVNSLHTDHDQALLSQYLEIQLEQQNKQMLENEQKYEQIRSLRHDMKHYLLNYRVLLDEGRLEDVQKNIAAILEGPLSSSDHPLTENRLLDALLHKTADTCRDQGIRFETRVILDPVSRDIPLMVLLSNLLENAVSHESLLQPCERLIRLELIDDHNKLSLIVQNRISESVLDTNPELKSTKLDSNIHGIGLGNVRKIVADRNGIIRIYEEHDFFCVHIILPSLGTDAHYQHSSISCDKIL